MSRLAQLSNIVLRSGLLWGAALAVGFYSPLNSALWANPVAVRYLAGHPVLYLETLLFFVAISTLAIRCLGIASEYFLLGRPVLGPIVTGGQPTDTCGNYLSKLAEGFPAVQDSYLVCRLRESLESVQRRNGAESLDDELKHLAARDRSRMLASYRLLWLVVSIVLLMGIATTIAQCSNAANQVAMSPAGEWSRLLTVGLADAFDATLLSFAIAACLLTAVSAVLVFELRLLNAVDEQAAQELVGRFQQFGSSNDPHLLAVRRMADAVVQVTERLVQRQTELWSSTIAAAHAEWSRLAGVTHEQTQSALQSALDHSLHEFAEQLAATSAASDAKNRDFWQRVQQSLGVTQNAPAPPREVLPFEHAENRAA